uniref:ubiquitinyl hydrolase 1 n=1 Tax=Astyanax mexicanus TaxID=7994 RepID=A0A3B1JQ49_ASTMX
MAAGAAGAQRGADRYQEEKLMDEHLKANGLYRRKIAKDGSCLFRAVAEQVLHCQGLHTRVRAECVKYLRQNRELYESFIEGDFDEYLQRLQDPQSWVGQVEISALAVLYKHDFIIYQNPGEPPVYVTENGYPDKVQLCFLNGNHYDSVYPASFAKNAAMCQSILYELLYERVCGVDRNMLASNMRGTKVRDESEESDLDEGENFWSSEATGKTASVNSRPPYRGRGRGQTRGGGRGFLPNKVQDSLNLCYFRNVEYDVWMKSKKAQQRRDFCMAAGMQYAVGDKCQVQLTGNGRYYSACIEDVSPNDGPVTVFIEELGEKHTVSLWNLRTPSDDSWSTEKGKRHSVSDSNEWDTRGGRKPARSVSIPYGPAGSAPSSHLQKQHSWPPQAPGESQGKNANSRKSDQDVGVLGVSPAEEEELLVLELLHKDENNFPSLEASAQAAAASGSGETGRRADKKGSRKKADAETKESLQKPDQRAERGKHKKKGSVGQEQPMSPPVKEKLSPSTPAVPPSAISPIPSAPVAAKPNPASLEAAPTPTPAQTAPAYSQTAPVPSKTAAISAGTATSRSETLPAASISSAQAAPASSPQTTSVPAPSPAHFQPTHVPTPALPQATAVPTPALPQATAVPTPALTFLTTPITTHALSAPSAQTTPITTHVLSAQTTPVPTPALAQTTPVPTPTLPQTIAVPTPTLSAQTPPSPIPNLPPTTSLPTPALFPQPTPVLTSVPTSAPVTHAPTPALPPTTPVPTPAHFQSTPVPTTLPTFAPATIFAMSTPVPSHSIPTLPVSDSEVPAQSNPCPAEFSVDSNNPPASLPPSAHVPSNPSHAQHSVTPPAPVNVSAASSVELAPFHPAGHGTMPVLAHCPPYMAPVPTSAPMLTPHAASSSAPPPPFPHPSEPHPCEPAASPVAGLGSATVPEFMPHGLATHPQHPQHPQHSTPLTQLSQLYQDPLYPGFPLNDQDEPANIPPFSHLLTGKDLPTDARVLRFFFNLGVKAFTNPLYPPLSYLTLLRQAHLMKPKVPPPAPSSSPYPPPWQPDNTPSVLHMTSTSNPTHHSLPVDSLGGGNSAGHFEMQGFGSWSFSSEYWGLWWPS